MNTPAPITLDPALTVGDITLVRWIEGHTYESSTGATYYSGAEEPSEADAADAVANPRTQPVTPAPVVPPEVTRRQLFLWLAGQGHTRAALRAHLEGIADPAARELALIEFDEAQTFKRDHPLIAQIATALGYTSAQIDAGFIAAAAL